MCLLITCNDFPERPHHVLRSAVSDCALARTADRLLLSLSATTGTRLIFV